MSKDRYGFGGIVISLGLDGKPVRALHGLTASSQTDPKGFYVYGHYDSAGAMFYVGKGMDRRAWSSDDRHRLWTRYVNRYLGGKYEVKILADALTNEEAETTESAVMMEAGDALVNWVHWGRKDDFAAIDRFHQLRNANRARLDQVKELEATDVEGAITAYQQCVSAISDYAFIIYEVGLVGRLLREEMNEEGCQGDFDVFVPYVKFLLRLKRAELADSEWKAYHAKYFRVLGMMKVQKLRARIDKALARK